MKGGTSDVVEERCSDNDHNLPIMIKTCVSLVKKKKKTTF